MRFTFSLGAMTVVALMATPLAAQHDQHGMRQDSTADRGCPMMSGMQMGQMGMMGGKDTAHMQGMMGMMAPDSSMMATMRFWPQHILKNGETLGLTSDQVRKVEALAPMHEAPMRDMASDTTHLKAMREAAAAVREILTPEQRTQAAKLPAPCGMMGGGTDGMHRMDADSVQGAGHGAHHR